MAKTFRPWDIEQQWLMPPSQLDFVPADHPAHFVQELSDFRKRHIVALARLFVQVLRLCREAGLVKLGHVALDGTKLKANASKHKAMSYARMKELEPKLAADVDAWLAKAAREDDEHGVDARGDELPDWVANKQKRLEKIREAKAALEAETAAEAAATLAESSADAETSSCAESSSEAEPTKRSRKKHRAGPDATPHLQSERNFTDPDSRMLKTADGFIQGYNGQIAVDASSQVMRARFSHSSRLWGARCD